MKQDLKQLDERETGKANIKVTSKRNAEKHFSDNLCGIAIKIATTAYKCLREAQ